MTTPRSRWQYVLILALALLALSVFFLPAMVRTETELRIRSTQQGLSLPDGFYVYQRLDARGIRIKSITPEGDGLVIRLDSPQQQLLARETLQAILPPGYTIALSELPTPSHWLRKLVSSPPQDLG